MRHMTRMTGLLMLLSATTSCSPSRTDVYSIVKSTHDKGNDTINLGASFGGDWDTMYWFPSNIPLEEINTIVDINSFWQDVGDRIVFVKGKKIVYYQEFFPHHETPMKRISLEPDSAQTIPIENATFSIRKVGDKVYVLTQGTMKE